MHATWWESRGGVGAGSDLDMRPILARDETQELEERRYSLCPAARREHIVRQVITIILRLRVVPKKDLDVTPRALYRVRVGAGFWIFERDAMVDGAVLVTLRVETAIRTPAIADDLRAWFDPFTYKIHQHVSGSVWYGNKKCSAGPSFDTAKHPLTLNRVTPMIFSPTELALINFDGFVRTTDLNRAALHEEKHNFPTEHAPISNCMCTVAMFMLNSESMFAAQDAIRNK